MRRIWTAKPLLVAYVVVVGFIGGILINRHPSPDAVPAVGNTANGGHADHGEDGREERQPPLWIQLFRPSQPTARWMLRVALPILTVADGSAQERRDLRVYLTGRAAERPQTLFQTMLPFLRPPDVALGHEPPPPGPDPGSPAQPGPPDSSGGGNVTPEPGPEPGTGTTPGAGAPLAAVKGGLPLVGIYHTHDWESYISEFPALAIRKPDDLRKIESPDHKKKTIVTIGDLAARRLKDLGITTVHAPLSHGSEGYDWAYTVSRRTARDILKKHPSVKILLDLHRDAAWGLDTTAVIKGQKVAQVRCIIGDYQQPRWQQNRAFCDQLMARMERKYPGMTLPTRLQNYTYNQDLMVGAILLEIGGATNQYAEAERAAVYLAEMLAEMIREGKYPN